MATQTLNFSQSHVDSLSFDPGIRLGSLVKAPWSWFKREAAGPRVQPEIGYDGLTPGQREILRLQIVMRGG